MADNFPYGPIVAHVVRILEPVNYGLLKHSLGVGELCRKIALQTGREDSDLFYLAGLAHDLGKSTWFEEMHYKFPLTPEEWEINHQHPLIGAEMVLEVFPQMPAEFVLAIAQHHERPGGRGTPKRVHELAWVTQVLAVADQFEAMTSPRPYRPDPFSPALAVSEIARKDRMAPAVVNALVRILDADELLKGVVWCSGTQFR